MNSKQVERQLRELVRRKPRINQPGRLIAHLLNELKIESDQQRHHAMLIEKALKKLAEEKIVKLQYSGSVLNGYSTTKKPQKPTPNQPKATPVDLPEERVEMKREERLPRHEMVTLALNALQEKANEAGEIYVSSTAEVIALELDIPKNEAVELNSALRDLGLRISPRGRNDQGKRPHWVSMEVTEVTKEQLATPSEVTSAPPEDTEQQLLDIIKVLETKVAELTSSADAAERLTQVIAGLEEKIATYEKAMGDANEALERKNCEVTTLVNERNSLNDEVRDLRSRLLARSAPSPAVADVLRRYGKS